MVSRNQYDNEALRKKLTLAMLGIVSFITVSVISVVFFSPQIGALFGFISKNRNVVLPQAEATVNPPVLIDLPEAIKEKKINIEGYADSGATVKLYINGPEAGTVITGADGRFLFSNVTLISGRNTIFAKAIDEKGRTSDRSETNIVTVDTKAPEIKINSPENGEKIENLNKRVRVEGEVSEKATIKVNGKLAIQKADFTFEYLLGVEEGNVEIKVLATDQAGNEKEEVVFIEYKKD